MVCTDGVTGDPEGPPGRCSEAYPCASKAVDFINQHPAETDRIMADAFKLRAIKTADGKTLPPEALVQEARKRIEWSVSLTKKDGAF